MEGVLRTRRLELLPMTAAIVEAVLLGRRDDAEALANARMPDRWPNRELIERAFSVSLDDVRRDSGRLWGARVAVLAAAYGAPERRVVGSIVFHGPPDDGTSEIAYGIEERSQRQGYATEAVGACVEWALAQPGVSAVRATTFGWHRASIRVLEKVGMVPSGVREHEVLGEMLVYERRRV